MDPDHHHRVSLYEAIIAIDSTDLAMRFLKDLCTPKELKDLCERFEIAQILYQDKLSYRDVQKITKASLTTIGRVARFLNEENYKGYKDVIDKIGEPKNDTT